MRHSIIDFLHAWHSATHNPEEGKNEQRNNCTRLGLEFLPSETRRGTQVSERCNRGTLNYLVRIFDARDVPDNQARLEQMVDNHLAGQRQKMRRRQRILENAAATSTSDDDSLAQRASSSESLDIIRSNVTCSQWRLLTELASGNSYQQLSADRGSSAGTIKSSICRLRKRLRKLVFEDDSMSIAA